MVVIAHLSDTHLDGGARSTERARRVVDYVDGLENPVDAVLVSGDIVDHGTVEEYAHAREVLSCSPPVLMCPGNHDARGAYRKALLGEAADDAPVNGVHRVGGAVLAVCDSSIPDQPAGYLADETLEWLGRVLADTPGDTPVLVCFHHPPVRLGIPYVDGIRQFGEQRLADLLAGHSNVVGILCGHAHTPAATVFAGRPLLVAPGVTSTARLPGEGGEVVDHELPPGLAFHFLDEDWRLTTHYRMLP